MVIKDKVLLILKQLSEKDKNDYLLQELQKNKKLRDQFLLQFDHLLNETPKPSKYRKLVKQIIKSHSGRYGYIEYRGSRAFRQDIMTLLNQAEDSLGNNPKLCFMISSVVIETLPTMAESMDDSNGETGYINARASDLILEYLKQANKKEKDQAFKWVSKNYLNNDYDDYGYDLSIIFDYFCGKDSSYKTEILKTYDLKIANSNEYLKERSLKDKLELLRLWGDEKAAKDTLLSNLHVSEIRQIAVDEELAAGNYNEAKRLIDEGIKVAEGKSRPGTVSDWQKQLLKIAQQENDIKETVYWAEFLFLDGWEHQMSYYQLLKQSSPDWESCYATLLTKLKGRHNTLNKIYAEEGDLESLFSQIKTEFYEADSLASFRNYRLSSLRKYLHFLIDDFPDEILELYEIELIERAKITGREIYESILNDLKQMQLLPKGNERVKLIIHDFKETYYNRPAMLEVLAKINVV